MNDLFVLNDYTENVFCATGPGGGVDPTCSKGGQRVEVDDIFYHGTVQGALSSIKEKGLVVGGGKGADQYAKETGEFVDFEKSYGEIEGRKVSVYVTTSEDNAAKYALRASKVNKDDTSVVLKVQIPSGNRVYEDEAGGRKAFRFEGKIQPEWITEVFIIDYDNDALVSKGPLVNNSQEYYLMFLVRPPIKGK